MNDRAKQDINNEVVEEAPVEAPVEQQTNARVTPGKNTKNT